MRINDKLETCRTNMVKFTLEICFWYVSRIEAKVSKDERLKIVITTFLQYIDFTMKPLNSELTKPGSYIYYNEVKFV